MSRGLMARQASVRMLVLGFCISVICASSVQEAALDAVVDLNAELNSEEPEVQATTAAKPDKGPGGTIVGTTGTFTVSDMIAPENTESDLGEGADIASSQVAELLEIAPTNHVTSATRLGEGAGGLRYTNGQFGEKGGQKKGLKCISECKGTGFGGYGWCYTSGQAKPWGGCLPAGQELDAPPRLYNRNKIASSITPRAHLFCKEKLWIQGKDSKRVAQCGSCDGNYFLVPNQHVQSKMVGTCFLIDNYRKWQTATTEVRAGFEDEKRSMDCSVFTNGNGMETPYFGGAAKDKWVKTPKASAYNPRGFVCTHGGDNVQFIAEGDLGKGFRSMRVFRFNIARFVTCHSNQEEGGMLQCTKQKRMGSCKVYFMRNAAFDSRAAHVVTPPAKGNTTRTAAAESDAWDDLAKKTGETKVKGKDPLDGVVIGLSKCDHTWQERLSAMF